MELSFSTLKQKDVIDVTDGKNLGKVCDVTLSFPECNWVGITVTGCKGFKFLNKHEQFIPVNFIVRIGEDAILVKPETPSCPPPKDKCPPPPCPPKPNSKPNNFPNNFQNNFPDRRDYGEYE